MATLFHWDGSDLTGLTTVTTNGTVVSSGGEIVSTQDSAVWDSNGFYHTAGTAGADDLTIFYDCKQADVTLVQSYCGFANSAKIGYAGSQDCLLARGGTGYFVAAENGGAGHGTTVNMDDGVWLNVKGVIQSGGTISWWAKTDDGTLNFNVDYTGGQIDDTSTTGTFDASTSGGQTLYFHLNNYSVSGSQATNIRNIFITDDGVVGPDAPTSVSATATGSTTATITWTDGAGLTDVIAIERKEGAGAYSEIDTVSGGVQTYGDTGLSASTTYTYRLRGRYATDNGPYSSEDSMTTQSAGDASATPMAARWIKMKGKI